MKAVLIINFSSSCTNILKRTFQRHKYYFLTGKNNNLLLMPATLLLLDPDDQEDQDEPDDLGAEDEEDKKELCIEIKLAKEDKPKPFLDK